MGVAHVLVVEDEVLVRAFIADELRSAGCAVIEARHADEALDYIHAGGKVDLIFSDIQMPGSLNGLQLAQPSHWYSQHWVCHNPKANREAIPHSDSRARCPNRDAAC